MKVLCVDDSIVVLKSLEETLVSAGHECITLAESLKAEDVCRADSFDIIVSDVNMPGLNGIEMIENLKEKDLIGEAFVLMLTTESNQALKTRAKGLGVKAWIIKPFAPNSLVTLFDNLAKKRAAG